MRRSFGDIGIAARRHPSLRTLPGPRLPKEQPIVGGERYAPIELAPDIRKHLEPVQYEGDSPLAGRVSRVVDWDKWSMQQRIAFLRSFVEDTARDPMIAQKAVSIIRQAGVQHRDYRAEWAALLKWVQQNVRFMAEPAERLQSPQYTLSTLGPADCDDMAILLAALGHSIRLPFRFVLSGRDARRNRHRWVEGVGRPPRGVNWTHIFVQAQWPPFRPTAAAWAEPTLDVELGWDFTRDPIPKDRGDIGEATEAVAAGKTNLQVLKEEGKILKAVKKLPWLTILGTVIGSALSFVLIQGVVRPAVEWRQRRHRRRR